jgi:hypothetical protein
MPLLLCSTWLAPAESRRSGQPACTQWGPALLPRHHHLLLVLLLELVLLLRRSQTAVA